MKFSEINGKFDMETSTSPDESPFSNGVVEWNNGALYETIMISMEDTKYNMETILA